MLDFVSGPQATPNRAGYVPLVELRLPVTAKPTTPLMLLTELTDYHLAKASKDGSVMYLDRAAKLAAQIGYRRRSTEIATLRRSLST